MSRRRFATLRNTSTHRLCRNCDGAGEVLRNDSASGDPQTEYPVACSAEGCRDGWVRFAPVDPLSRLASARRLRRIFPHRYGALRMRAVSPVQLPDSPSPFPIAWPQAA